MEGLQDGSLKAEPGTEDADVGCSGVGDQKVWVQGFLGGGRQKNGRGTSRKGSESSPSIIAATHTPRAAKTSFYSHQCPRI